MPIKVQEESEDKDVFFKAKNLLLELKLSHLYHEEIENQERIDFLETELRQIFTTLGSNDRMLILYEAIMANSVGIADNDKKLDFYKRAEHIGFMFWAKKVIIVTFAFIGVSTFSIFMFAIIKNGAFNDLSFLASFLKTINEILNVVFLTH